MDIAVQPYHEILIQRYKSQPIVPVDWPPRVGEDFFGRLTLFIEQDMYIKSEDAQMKRAWCMLRGNIDEIPEHTRSQRIDISGILEPINGQSLRVVVDGPPGIGKTTLCRKILNMWATGTLDCYEYDIVLYCPLRNPNIAKAATLADLSVYESPKVFDMVEWMIATEGKRLLIVFDGWDELNTELRETSLASKIICRDMLANCSVIVTSRSYASASLLEICEINRHVQVMGFSKTEIKTVVLGALGKETELAEKLIKDLSMREDVLSLCYIPLICSLVISVYRKLGQQLPTTLTELYKNFILQTVRRHVKISTHHSINHKQLHSLENLPSTIAASLDEMAHFAYSCLKENSPKITYSSLELQESLANSVKENYLGLMTTVSVCDEETCQFLHLSIQEFLAAWWLARSMERAVEGFNTHFNDGHFRLCLRFLSGLTHLEHESYQQYFNKAMDLQCQRRPLFGIEDSYYSFHVNPKMTCQHIEHSDNLFNEIFLFHLLYESQNTDLCNIFAQSFVEHSMCLRGHIQLLNIFDFLAFSFFLNNSDIVWNCLDLGVLGGDASQTIFANSMTAADKIKHCKIINVDFGSQHDPVEVCLTTKFFQSAFFDHIEECYIKLYTESLCVAKFLIELLKHNKLKVLHLEMFYNRGIYFFASDVTADKHMYSEVEECFAINCVLQEVAIHCNSYYSLINAIVNGLTRNKTVWSFSLEVPNFTSFQLITEDEIEIWPLLEKNSTLRAFHVWLSDYYHSEFKVHDKLSNNKKLAINTSLTALSFERLLDDYRLPRRQLLLPRFRKVKSFILYRVSLIFKKYPNLQQLNLQLDTPEEVDELFTILQNNDTLKYLKVLVICKCFYDQHVLITLQNMLSSNKTLKSFEIDFSDESFHSHLHTRHLSHLATGLSHNNSLQTLGVPVTFFTTQTDYEERRAFFNVIAKKENLANIYVSFQCEWYLIDQHAFKFFENDLPVITKMLESHRTLIQFKLLFSGQYDHTAALIAIGSAQKFWKAVLCHPTLQYVSAMTGGNPCIFKEAFDIEEKTISDNSSLPVIETKKHRNQLHSMNKIINWYKMQYK